MLLGKAGRDAGRRLVVHGGSRGAALVIAAGICLCTLPLLHGQTAVAPQAAQGSAPAKTASGSGKAVSASAKGSSVQKPVRHKRRAAKPAPVPVALPPIIAQEPIKPNWPANDPSQPAHVSWDGNRLMVTATNASLSQVLHEVSSATGLEVEGLDSSRDQRIFGSFGPAEAKDVLNQLLDGAGYNVIILGDRGAGNPRQLLLAVQAAAPAKGAGNHAAAAQQPEEEPEPEPEPQPEPERPQQGPPPPGARPAQQYLQDLRNQQQQGQPGQPGANPGQAPGQNPAQPTPNQ